MIIVSLMISMLFQLTTSRGGRLRFQEAYPSIALYFNSRPHEEVDHTYIQPNILLAYFNSRPHEEVDMEWNLILL